MGLFGNLQYRPSRSAAAWTTAILVGLVLFTLVYRPVPWAVAASGVYVRTESGITRCLIKPDEVACEAGGDAQTYTLPVASRSPNPTTALSTSTTFNLRLVAA